MWTKPSISWGICGLGEVVIFEYVFNMCLTDVSGTMEVVFDELVGTCRTWIWDMSFGM